ncbi:hypothetical protein Tco_0884144 [Tanacetum coccineum]
MVEITNVVIPVNVNDDDEEITDEVYELKRREKGKLIEETRNLPIPTPIRSPRIHTNLVSSDTEKLQEWTGTPHTTSSSSSPNKMLFKTNQLLSLFNTKATRASFTSYKDVMERINILAQISTHIENAISNVIPSQVDASVRSYMSGHILYVHLAQS